MERWAFSLPDSAWLLHLSLQKQFAFTMRDRKTAPMKKLILIVTTLLLHNSAIGQKMPNDNQFFREETVLKAYNIPGAKIKTLSTAKNFKTLSLELKNLLGEGWVTEEPKQIKDPKIRQRMEANGLSPESTVIYVAPNNPKLRVTLSLTKRQGKEEGEAVAILTIARNF